MKFFFFLANSFIIKTRDGGRKAFRQDNVAHLKEGAFTEANTNCSHPPECITVRIEVNDPKYLVSTKFTLLYYIFEVNKAFDNR